MGTDADTTGKTANIDTSEVSNLEYLKMSYPSLKEGTWNTHEA